MQILEPVIFRTCNKAYIGETGLKLADCFHEHKQKGFQILYVIYLYLLFYIYPLFETYFTLISLLIARFEAPPAVNRLWQFPGQ